MSLDIKNTLQQLLEESRNFNQNDLLVNVSVDSSKVKLYNGELKFKKVDFPGSILKEAKRQLSESGINSLCLSQGLVKLPHGESYISTPILLIPCELSINSRTNELTIDLLEDDVFINPYLLNVIRLDYNKSIPDELLLEPKFEDWNNFIKNIGFDTASDAERFFGNFHHHRYQVVKELEELLVSKSYSNALRSMLGDAISNPFVLQKLYTGHLFAADPDHEHVFELIEKDDVVVQGPPGTGKSQVLSNILGKALLANYSVLVLSEKRAALDVLKKRLAEYDLDQLCFISSSESLSKNLLSELEIEWNSLNDAEINPTNNLLLSHQYEANLDFILDLLNQPHLIGGISYYEFQKIQNNITHDKYSYSSEIPQLDHFIEIRPLIENLYNQEIVSSIRYIKLSVLQSKELHLFDEKINQWKQSLHDLALTIPFTSWSELSDCMRKSAICQVFENDLYKKYNKVFKPNSREQRKFKKLVTKRQKSLTQLNQLQSDDVKWKMAVTSSELIHLLSQLNKRNLFNKKAVSREWKNLTDAPIEIAKQIIERKLRIIEEKANLSNILIEFCDLDILDSNEIDNINHLLPVYNEEKWSALNNLSESTRLKITNLHIDINSLWRELSTSFVFNNDDNVVELIESVKWDLQKIIPNHHLFTKLTQEDHKLLSISQTKDDFIGILLHSHWILLQQKFPLLAQFELNQIGKKIDVIRDLRREESNLFAQEIKNIRIRQFQEASRLLNTPAQKLTDQEKERKKRLRKGKSILVKEFAKTRNHPSIRDLFNSEAREWITLMKPIWLSNPVQLAKCFPLQEELFDICVFDEASQIPLQNSLGGIQRAKRVIVAGDEQQMGPSSFFKVQSSEVVDLLHQASFYWKKTGLMHHYRSSHPDLISFSNKHFYRGQLKAFPSYHQSSVPLNWHFVENGTYIDRKNVREAERVASLIVDKLNAKVKIGVVAFSEEQLNEIWNKLSIKTQEQFQGEIDTNSCFFKSLENVQGDECDELIVSFGYGYNESGEFNMRFGPMNTENGRRRLNVLLTRAKNEIHFFSSIKSTDFKPTDNESVDLLIRWFRYIESYKPSSASYFPYDVKTDINGNQLTLHGAYKEIPNAKELINYHIVLQQKGWELNYI